MKLRRPTFSLRTLLMIPVLIAAYFALGIPTESWGVRDVQSFVANGKHRDPAIKYKAPLVLEHPVLHALATGGEVTVVEKNSYYFWCFGFVTKVPFKTETTREVVSTN